MLCVARLSITTESGIPRFSARVFILFNFNFQNYNLSFKNITLCSVLFAPLPRCSIVASVLVSQCTWLASWNCVFVFVFLFVFVCVYFLHCCPDVLLLPVSQCLSECTRLASWNSRIAGKAGPLLGFHLLGFHPLLRPHLRNQCNNLTV